MRKLLSSVVRVAGSLWLAAVILVLLLVAMACATVVESTHGAELALEDFYASDWFIGLLGLLAVNIFFSMVLRYPFTRRHIGFLLTHVSILVTLGGAYTTYDKVIDAQLGLAEGQSADHVIVRKQDTLTVAKRNGEGETSVELRPAGIGKLRPLESPDAPALVDGKLRVEVLRYLPDSEWVSQMTNDASRPNPAVEVSRIVAGADEPVWVLLNESAALGPHEATYRRAAGEAELQTMLAPKARDATASVGTIQVKIDGASHELAVEDCMDKAVPLGDTGYTAKVLRYLPHASVVLPERTIVNISDRPENPALEVEFTGPGGTDKRVSFATMPGMVMGKQNLPALEFAFVAGQMSASDTAIQLIEGPEGTLHVRFAPPGGEVVAREMAVGAPVESPWPGETFVLRQRFDRARLGRVMAPVEPVRERRAPALLLRVESEGASNEMWVEKNRPRPVSANGTVYDIFYGDKTIPLGFEITLNKFNMTFYPGTRRPRTFESHVTITDGDMSEKRVISMNRPVQHAGFSFYQSSYDDKGETMVSFLSVSDNAGQTIVYIGYIAMIVGMLVVLATRMKERRQIRRAEEMSAGAKAKARPRV